jgi:tetrapyrrole methylase family protein / MazG family protein
VSEDAPRVVAVGIGPAGRDLVPQAVRSAIESADRVFIRTNLHPSAELVHELAPGRVVSFDEIYETAVSFAQVYEQIVEELVGAAVAVSQVRGASGQVVYAVPGSPLVAERTVELLRSDQRVDLVVVPAMSFLDLAWERLGVDPVASSVRIVDGTDFEAQAAGERGPLLVAQTHSRAVLSGLKLAVDNPPPGDDAAVLLHHLGLEDERVEAVAWSEIDRVAGIEPDHLTSVWIRSLEAPVAGELIRLVELVRTLRAECPWDREQTHGSLARHLLEEAYEALDAIEDVAAAGPDVPEESIAHLEEELGDLVFQVVFHAALAAEQGWFTLADVATRLADKLVGRHPHVFGDAVADTPEDVARRWEVLKREEQGRASVTDGIPRTFPALALAAKLQRKAESVGLEDPGPDGDSEVIMGVMHRLAGVHAGSSGETLEAQRSTVDQVGEALFALADLARRLGVDPESALRARSIRFMAEIRAAEGLRETGGDAG